MKQKKFIQDDFPQWAANLDIGSFDMEFDDIIVNNGVDQMIFLSINMVIKLLIFGIMKNDPHIRGIII